MTDYSDLVERLRRDGIAARDTLKCAELAPTVDPEDALDAADAIEALLPEKMLVERLLNETTELRGRIRKLEAALKLMIDTQDDWEKGVSEVIGKQPDIFNRAIDAARKVLGEKK